MSNSALLTNPDRSNKVVCLTSHCNSLPLTQTIPSHQQPHSQPNKSRRRAAMIYKESNRECN